MTDEATAGEKIIGDFYKKPTSKQILRDCVDFLDQANFSFTLFCENFKRFLKEEGKI